MPCVLGPLAPFADGFRRALADRGYACEPVRKQTLLMAHVSRWLAGHGLGPAELTGTIVERSLAARRVTAITCPCGRCHRCWATYVTSG
jgi:hypothetical protein